MARVFVSYAMKDRFVARDIADRLTRLGTDVWTSDQLEIGDDLSSKIEQELAAASVLVVLITRDSLRSHWVTSEWTRAMADAKRVIPVLYEVSFDELPPGLATRQGLKVENGDIDGVARSIHEVVSRMSSAPAPKLAEDSRALVVRAAVEEVLADLGYRPGVPKVEEGPVVDDKLVFVVISYEEKMEPVYEAIEAAASAVGLKALRLKDVHDDFRITEQMLKMIREARFVVADLTDEKQNVYFELGYARGLGKKVITIAHQQTKIHFDVYDWVYIPYLDSRPLERKLVDRFRIELERDAT
ncbi:hypothetical protein GCM10022243_26680 [Saccharothrix violaceirubra]|uniref:TIR domain-containing protein n=1 Tax=Saccharothrix violaceirubra TaxID=413306 RepID=A0A7W7WZE9_9PSEU|nr:toll/interleukin-1 receptor domain-containing protein [Saccharothrix violaceirubra]MBB4969410.1 hypothetical protein [Saccharothrix violaceirubra]